VHHGLAERRTEVDVSFRTRSKSVVSLAAPEPERLGLPRKGIGKCSSRARSLKHAPNSSRHWTRDTPRTGRWRSPGCGTVTMQPNWSMPGGSRPGTLSAPARRRDKEMAIRVTMTVTVEMTDNDASIYQDTFNTPDIFEDVRESVEEALEASRPAQVGNWVINVH